MYLLLADQLTVNWEPENNFLDNCEKWGIGEFNM
jgi:hypothetical protein